MRRERVEQRAVEIEHQRFQVFKVLGAQNPGSSVSCAILACANQNG
jgi:hypothetical protein